MDKYKLEDYLPEEEFNQIDEPEDPQHIDDIPSVKLYVDDNEKLTIQISAFYHGPENKKIPLLVGNEVLQDLLLKAFQIESQKMFRKVVHGVLGEPYGLPENIKNNKNKTMTNETKLWQLRAGLITEGEYQESLEEFNLEKKPATGTGQLAADFIGKAKDIRQSNQDITGTEPSLISKIADKLLSIAKSQEIKNSSSILIAIDRFIDSKMPKAGSTPAASAPEKESGL